MSYFNELISNISFNMETIGYIGSILLAICGIPEAIRAFINKRCEIGWLMLISWFLGEVLFLTYLLSKFFAWQSIINYGTNILAILVLLYYKYKGAKNDRREKVRSKRSSATIQL